MRRLAASIPYHRPFYEDADTKKSIHWEGSGGREGGGMESLRDKARETKFIPLARAAEQRARFAEGRERVEGGEQWQKRA